MRIGQRVRAHHARTTGASRALELPDATIAARGRRRGDPGRAALGGAANWCPASIAPDEFRAIVNAHFSIAPPPGTPLMTGVIGGTAEWIFAFPDRISVTVSGADAIVDKDREELARLFWADVAKVLRTCRRTCRPGRSSRNAAPPSPPRRAQAAQRPKTATRWPNLLLAGDWTDTGLPATIEGAVRSGHKAARLALSRASV